MGVLFQKPCLGPLLAAFNRITPDLAMIRSKVEDYTIPWEQFAQGLDQAQSTLRNPKTQTDFIAEMSRFVSMSMANQFAKYPKVSAEWLINAIELLREMKNISWM